MFNLQSFKEDCLAIREQSPLVHNITNYVAMNIAANGLLAIGASPLMSFCEEEMQEIVSISSAIVVNIGCLDRNEIAAMRLAAKTAHELGKPWVLDPVGAGASKIRTQTCMDLIREFHPAIIRGNASEIMCLAGEQIKSRGVDSSASSSSALDSARALAKSTGAVISVSGPTDYITDGQRVGTISNGHPMMPKVTALGCTASAITGAFAAVDKDYFNAALNAMALMGMAGELAAKDCSGTGTLALRIIDELSNFDPDAAASIIKE